MEGIMEVRQECRIEGRKEWMMEVRKECVNKGRLFYIYIYDYMYLYKSIVCTQLFGSSTPSDQRMRRFSASRLSTSVLFNITVYSNVGSTVSIPCSAIRPEMLHPAMDCHGPQSA